LEVGTTVNTVDELKQKWAKFKAQEVLAASTDVLATQELNACIMQGVRHNHCSTNNSL
jgi:hypothetical protein